MCGIAGIISKSKQHDNSSYLHAMTDALSHRGPDDSGYYETYDNDGNYIGLGHRRLAIIDIESGKQPISDHSETLHLVFNGEIYNFEEIKKNLISKGYKFETSSDSEVIVYAYQEYGERCVEKFRGMFAFAIWDTNRNRLFIARDRFGKKPLFYTIIDGDFYFSSEIKSFNTLPNFQGVVNEASIQDYLVYRYMPQPQTFYKGVSKINPGSYAIFEKGQLHQSTYYCPADKYPLKVFEEARDALSTFKETLDEAVQLRMISDVPFGAFLSGGIDSTAVVALMTNHSSMPVKTFSVGFKESNYSELKYAESVAKHFKTEHHELVVSHEQIIEHLPGMVKYRDGPVCEPSDIPIYLLSLEASRSVKMVLTGEGSDEILGGYPKHTFERYTKYYQYLPRPIRHFVFQNIVNLLPYGFRRAKTALATLNTDDPVERLPRWFGALGFAEVKKILKPSYHGSKNKENRQFETDATNSSLRKILYFDQTSWLPDNLLERGDRMTMAASIEARMPFMDHKLAEFVSSLPDKYRVRGKQTKWILRETMKGLVPEEILNRPKVGFRLPVNEWFQGKMKDYLHEQLFGQDSISSKFYVKKSLGRIFSEHTKGRQNHEKLLWTLLNLELWLKESESRQ